MSGVIDNFRGPHAILSNFYFLNMEWEAPPPTADGETIVYPTLEHAFQAAKTLDLGVRLRMSKVTSPMDVKKLGQALSPLRPQWKRRVRLDVMAELITIKFAAGTDAAAHLTSTRDAVLVEGNTWHDNFWGDCRCGRLPRCAARGQNRLGTFLMWRRARLRGYGPAMQAFLKGQHE